MAQQLWYDVVAHENGWAIVITPDRIESFPTKQAAFDAAVEYARKLRLSAMRCRSASGTGARVRRPSGRKKPLELAPPVVPETAAVVSAAAPACRQK
jgi:hypothetical protein